MRTTITALATACAFLLSAPAVAGPDRSAQPDAQASGDAATGALRQELLAQANRLRENRDWLGALALYERLHAADPSDDQAYRLRVMTLADLGSAWRAWELYSRRPAAFTADDAERLSNDRIARAIVWGGAFSEDPLDPRQDMERAARLMQEHMDSLDPARRRAAIRMRLDELFMLNAMERHDQVVASWRQLQAEGVEIPVYVLAKVGDSLLATRQPREATAVLEQVITLAPDDHAAHLLLAYAYLESERHHDARALLRRIADANPAWLREPGSKSPHQNWRRYDADTNLAMIHGYGNDLPFAQQQIEALAAVGPANSGLQSSLGRVYQMRGWPTRALERQRMAITLDPRSVQARIGAVEALIALRRNSEARAGHDSLLADFPDNTQVRRLHRYWETHAGWRGHARTSGGRNSNPGGGSGTPAYGNREGEREVLVESPLLADNWRVSLAHADRHADFHGQRIQARYATLGLRHVHDRLDLLVQAFRFHDDWAPGNGLAVEADWRFSDTLSSSARLARNDPAASLQARASGITGDSAQASLNWSPDERRLLGTSVKQTRYDDGNRRTEWSGYGVQRLLSRPHLTVDGTADLFAGRASQDDAPYFNPRSDHAWSLGARAHHVAWRHYDRQLQQRLDVSVGQYWQQGHGSAWIPRLQYRHEWKLGIGQVLGYGVNWSRPVYDGQRERHLGWDIEYRWGWP